MSSILLLMHSDGSFNLKKPIARSSLDKAIGDYAGMEERKDLSAWYWQDEKKTMRLELDIFECESDPSCVEKVYIGYILAYGGWTKTASEREMLEEALKIAFYLQKKLGLDVIDDDEKEYLSPDKEGKMLKYLRNRAKQTPKRKKRFLFDK